MVTRLDFDQLLALVEGPGRAELLSGGHPGRAHARRQAELILVALTDPLLGPAARGFDSLSLGINVAVATRPVIDVTGFRLLQAPTRVLPSQQFLRDAAAVMRGYPLLPQDRDVFFVVIDMAGQPTSSHGWMRLQSLGHALRTEAVHSTYIRVERQAPDPTRTRS